MSELTMRVMQLARQSLGKGYVVLFCGGVLAMVCKLLTPEIYDPKYQWITGPTNTVLLVLIIAGVGLVIQSRILFHAAHTGLAGATFQRVFSRSWVATRETRRTWAIAAGKLIGEMLVGAGAAWGIFRLAMNNERLPPGTLTVIVGVVLGIALFMAAIGTCLGLWMGYIAATTAPPMATTER
jgi:hypothetical protein